MLFQDKVVVVTGGSSGIGFATAEQFITEGALVIIASLNLDSGEKAVAKLGSRAFFIQTDVCLEDSVENLFNTTIKKFGRLDILINDAGVSLKTEKDVTTFSLADFDKTMDTNFKGVFLCTKYAILHLIKVGGNIVNIASRLGLEPSKDAAFIYSSSKAAVIMFTKAMALNYVNHGVRINCVCPGGTDTPLLRELFDTEKAYLAYAKSKPMGRLSRPEEIANVITFLASPKASSVTGSVYSVDGGALL